MVQYDTSGNAIAIPKIMANSNYLDIFCNTSRIGVFDSFVLINYILQDKHELKIKKQKHN